eukprot:m.128146 g.128146  ORF g.128146 m.128146 type:complete len:301 (-) comp9407_c1_seq1:761-1663(-)
MRLVRSSRWSGSAGVSASAAGGSAGRGCAAISRSSSLLPERKTTACELRRSTGCPAMRARKRCRPATARLRAGSACAPAGSTLSGGTMLAGWWACSAACSHTKSLTLRRTSNAPPPNAAMSVRTITCTQRRQSTRAEKFTCFLKYICICITLCISAKPSASRQSTNFDCQFATTGRHWIRHLHLQHLLRLGQPTARRCALAGMHIEAVRGDHLQARGASQHQHVRVRVRPRRGRRRGARRDHGRNGSLGLVQSARLGCIYCLQVCDAPPLSGKHSAIRAGRGAHLLVFCTRSSRARRASA